VGGTKDEEENPGVNTNSKKYDQKIIENRIRPREERRGGGGTGTPRDQSKGKQKGEGV